MQRIYDGDTLELKNGTRVRLAGINTPELGRDGTPDQPFALQAREQLERLVRESGQRIRLEPAVERRDRYARLLAHLYSSNGANLQEQLLDSGRAFVNVHPPNLSNLECYLAAEERARSRSAGLWRYLNQADADAEQPGFTLLRGRVERVRRTRRSIWVELGEGPSLRIAKSDLGYFADFDFSALAGAELEARGWLYRHRGRMLMRIRHPAALAIR